MLTSGQNNIPVSTWGYLISVELEDTGEQSVTEKLAAAVAMRLTDAPSFMEGVGKVEVEILGKLDLYEEKDDVV